MCYNDELMAIGKDYLLVVKERGKKSRVYRKYQLTGLMLAEILGDEKHKSLYIKLAKEHSENFLLRMARDVAERANVKNRGAYFMRLITSYANRKYRKQK